MIGIELTNPVEQTVTYEFEDTDFETDDSVASIEFEMSLIAKQQFDLLLDDAGFLK